MGSARKAFPALLAALVVALVAGSAAAQPTFSIDLQGPTAWPGAGLPDSFFANTITAADILSGPVGGPPIGLPGAGPLPTPGLVIHGSGITPTPAGVRTLGIAPVPGSPLVEVDALSYGRDLGDYIYFSVDEFASGHPIVPAIPPNVLTEGAIGFWTAVAPPPIPSNLEASADVFADIAGLPARLLAGQPLPPVVAPPSPPAGNVQVYDGDGLLPTGNPGFGLVDLNPPTPNAPPGQPLPDGGDNLDALNIDTTAADLRGPVFYSLDSGLADPLESGGILPVNTATALANNLLGGDVVVDDGAAGISYLYAGAAALGLDGFQGIGQPWAPGTAPDTDDLDALILLDDGARDGKGLLYFNPLTDLLVFSIRRGSAATLAMSQGTALDSLWGVPIEEGDILLPPGTPLPGGGFVPGPTPGIAIPAEWLGLFGLRTGVMAPFADDLDALDLGPMPPQIPEPVSLVLLGSGLLALLRRRRKSRTR